MAAGSGEAARFVDNHEAASYIVVNPEYPGVTKVHDAPPLYVVRDFLTSEECDLLITMGAGGLKRSVVVDGKLGKSAAPSRTSESCYLKKEETSWLADKINNLIGKPQNTHEPPQVARYLTDQYYRAHYDAFDMTTEPGRECARVGGQRVATVLIYLNDVTQGGATYFSNIDVRVQPVRGSAAIFFPCDLAGRLDQKALHTAEEAVNEKWVCQVWVREREYA